MRYFNIAPIATTLLIANAVILSALAQKPLESVDVKLLDFTLPPFPVELVGLTSNPASNLRYQTLMPIAGRIASTTDEAKLKGAIAPPAGVFIYTGGLDVQGKVSPGQGSVFGQPDARLKLAEDTPIDWAVWGTKASDGPLRLPYGGSYEQLPPNLAPTRRVRQMSLAVSGSGLNYANYSLYPRYRLINRFIDPVSNHFVSRAEEVTPQQAANQQKLARYIPVEGDSPWQRGQVIALSPTRYEGVATRFVEGDKTASAKQVSLLTFDEAGNLLKDQPIDFPYTRKLTARLPVCDATGKIVGTFSVFADGGGKKDARDPEENRFAVVVTDEQGQVWNQFSWTNGEGSGRAIIPTYVLRKGDDLLVYTTNQQKVLKPVEESWRIDKAGKATLLSSLPGGELADRSKEIGAVNNGQRAGWYNYTGSQYIDSFTDAKGDVWLLLQRQADAPGGSTSMGTPTQSAPAGRLMGFANKLNQLTGQTPPVTAAPAPQSVESGKIYSDLFVLHFDADLKLKQQTVIALDPMPDPVRFKRSVRASGADYVLNNAANTRLRIRYEKAIPEALSVERLTPVESVPLAGPDTDNFVIDETIGKIYVLYGVPRKPGLGRLLTYSLD